MRITVLLLFALLFGIVVPIQAQLTYSVEEYVKNQGDTVQIPIRAKNFSDILTLQYTFEWDNTVLKYLSTDTPILNGWNLSTYNDVIAPEGMVRYIWLDAEGSGKSMDDDMPIMVLNFEVIGNPGDSTSLSFPEMPTPPQYAKVGDTSPQIPALVEGKLKVYMDVGTIDPADYGWEIKEISPNPFNQRAVIEFVTPNASEVQWSILDVTGKLINKICQAYPAGVNHFVLEQQLLPTNGLYFIKLETPEFVVTQKIDFFR